jgi:hypothetical protein
MRETVPGAICAEVLIAAGGCHREVIAALQREIGLNAPDAQAAWEATAQKRAALRCRAVVDARTGEFGQ